MTEIEYNFQELFEGSTVAPSFGIMRQTKTLYGPLPEGIRDRPFFLYARVRTVGRYRSGAGITKVHWRSSRTNHLHARSGRSTGGACWCAKRRGSSS